MTSQKTPLYHEDDHAFLGFLVKDTAGWVALTIFGYTMVRTATKEEAENFIHQHGREFLSGIWQYYDAGDNDWYSCTIKDANQHLVTIIRTNALGLQDRETYKQVILKDPTDEQLIKSA
jgi:hypothetical protein